MTKQGAFLQKFTITPHARELLRLMGFEVSFKVHRPFELPVAMGAGVRACFFHLAPHQI